MSANKTALLDPWRLVGKSWLPPLVIPLLGWLADGLASSWGGPGTQWNPSIPLFAYYLLGLPLAWAATAFVGVPLILLVARFGGVRGVTLVGLGAVSGVLEGIAYSLLDSPQSGLKVAGADRWTLTCFWSMAAGTADAGLLWALYDCRVGRPLGRDSPRQ